MGHKMRIQLVKDGMISSDRLVDQKIEFYNGPKEKHDGPMRIEFVFEDSSDAEGAITYIQKLLGKLPIEQKVIGTRGRKPGEEKTFNDTSREVLLKEAIKNSQDQDKFITFLRERDFVFITGEHLKKLIPEGYNIKSRHLEQYEWLVRRIKEAKDPRADKFDIALLLGIKILSDRSEKILLYMNGELGKNIKLEVPEKAFNFKQTNLIKFPHYMTHEEREKWGIEHRQLMANPAKKPSKFYVRWMKDVTVGDEMKLEIPESDE